MKGNIHSNNKGLYNRKTCENDRYIGGISFDWCYFRCVSEEGCNGDVSHVNGNGPIMPSKDDLCLSTAFDVDKIVEYLNHSLGEGMAEKSRYSSFFRLIHIWFLNCCSQ